MFCNFSPKLKSLKRIKDESTTKDEIKITIDGYASGIVQLGVSFLIVQVNRNAFRIDKTLQLATMLQNKSQIGKLQRLCVSGCISCSNEGCDCNLCSFKVRQETTPASFSAALFLFFSSKQRVSKRPLEACGESPAEVTHGLQKEHLRESRGWNAKAK